MSTEAVPLVTRLTSSNHGSFYFTQVASLHLINNDKQSAAATIKEYFDTVYKGQIDADGNQPFENERTRPYHYLSYNLVAMMVCALFQLTVHRLTDRRPTSVSACTLVTMELKL